MTVSGYSDYGRPRNKVTEREMKELRDLGGKLPDLRIRRLGFTLQLHHLLAG